MLRPGGGRRASPRACGAAAGARTWAAKRANMRRMSKMQSVAVATFTAREREYIRRELDSFFSTLPSVAAGFHLKTGRGGPEAGKPKLSPTAAGLLDRGLMRLDTRQRLPRLFFTEAGLTALRAMMADRRLADPAKFAHIRQELGVDPVPDTDPPQEGSRGSVGSPSGAIIHCASDCAARRRAVRPALGPVARAWRRDLDDGRRRCGV